MDYAIVIGINDYTPQNHGGLKTLMGAIHDADAVEQWLISQDGGKLLPENCKKIISTAAPLLPLKDQIDDKLEEILEDIMINSIDANRFYFYFAGHGVGVETDVTDTGLCLAKWSNLRRNNAISIEKYRKLILSTGYFKQVIFWADCCRNSIYNVSPEGSTVQLPVNGPNAGSARYFTGYATQYQDQSYEIENNGAEMRGIFTEVLLQGLKGGAANRDGIVDADYLRDYLTKETPALARTHGYKQVPETFHSFPSTEPCIFHAVNVFLPCTIHFTAIRQGAVSLIDGSGAVVGNFNAATQNPVTIQLKKGLHKLKEEVSGAESYFTVSPEKTTGDVYF